MSTPLYLDLAFLYEQFINQYNISIGYTVLTFFELFQ